ncbi:hypothetical protein SKAU_G00312040 [Synaphobranchus kaupii]|uniref:Uncharacterized protein n=1 Tax=Synaphobranchus kaupii TaxID=118154 RepID=A0A9Q1ERV4_SYNKA|nr:hypothetical protein SKAU_G00312040 [Synaphobranchus kaupii]
MATVVPFASCYAANGLRPLQLFRNGPGGGYLCLLTYHGPRGVPRPRVAYRGPKMTLRQICRMLRAMREGGPAGTRKQTSPVPPPGSPVVKVTERRCFPACFRRRRSGNIKRVG